jgi:hypothetical protein
MHQIAKKRTPECATSKEHVAPGFHSGESGVNPTVALQPGAVPIVGKLKPSAAHLLALFPLKMPGPPLLFFLALSLHVLSVGTLIGLDVFEAAFLVTNSVQFSSRATSMRSSCRHCRTSLTDEIFFRDRISPL